MKVERTERAGKVVKCTLVDGDEPGLVASADVERAGDRLMVTQLAIQQDQHTGGGHPAEVTRSALRRFDPAAIVRALTDHLANPAPELAGAVAADGAADLRDWFRMADAATGTEFGTRFMGQRDAAAEVVDGTTVPRRRGRPPKFPTDAEKIRWTRVALEIDAASPRSLREELAKAMRASGREELATSTRNNARDLIRILRRDGFLQPSRGTGTHDPLVPGPNYPIGDTTP